MPEEEPRETIELSAPHDHPWDWFVDHTGQLWVGVEMEVEEGGLDCLAVELDQYGMGKQDYALVFDGSLRYGAEIVSPPLRPERVGSWLTAATRAARSAGWECSHRCGLHFHFSRNALAARQIARAYAFVQAIAPREYLEKLSRRGYVSEYALWRLGKTVVRHWRNPRSRYQAVNLAPENTIEFRLFRGTVSGITAIASYMWCKALLEYCAITGMRQLSIDGLTGFAHAHLAEYAPLVRYLQARGLCAMPALEFNQGQSFSTAPGGNACV